MGDKWVQARTRTAREEQKASVRCSLDRKAKSNLRSGWGKADQKRTLFADGFAHWAALFVRLDPNGQTRTIWGRAVELALCFIVFPFTDLVFLCDNRSLEFRLPVVLLLCLGDLFMPLP